MIGRIGGGEGRPARSVEQDAEAAVAGQSMPPPGTLAHLVAQPSPIDRLVSGAGALARFAAADPSPLSAPGMTIRRNEILPDIAARHAIGAVVSQPLPPVVQVAATAHIADAVTLDGRVDKVATVLRDDGHALPPSARVEPTARPHEAPLAIIVPTMGDGRPTG